MFLSPQRLQQILDQLPPADHYRVAYSGGRDSHVLLHLFASLVRLNAHLRVSAIHIDHGLQRNSGQWSDHCRSVCRELGVAIEQQCLALQPVPGESIEALAREARYRAIRQLLEPGDMLVTAHHQEDQAETVLLQLLRGAGPAGLSAMPPATPFGAGLLGRPFLAVQRQEIVDYADGQELDWIEDPSNKQLRYDRNYLRRQVMPLLQKRWPAAARTLSRSARHCAEAQQLIETQASGDLERLADREGRTLALTELLALAPSRARALVRAWVRKADLPSPSSAHLDRLLREMQEAGQDRNPIVHWPGVQVRRYRQRLYLMTPQAPLEPGLRISWDGGLLELPADAGTLTSDIGKGGIAQDQWRCGMPQIRFESTREAIRIAGRGHSTSLKKLYQQRGVPPWMRQRVPLIYLGGELAAVADLCICESFAAEADVPGIRLRWSATCV